MKRNSRISRSQALATMLVIGIFFIATAQAQTDLAIFNGKFTLTTQVMWGEMVLHPGVYTVSIGSSDMPILVLVSDSSGRPVGRLVSRIDDGKISAGNALLIREERGRLRVYALSLASLGRMLVYDPALAREAIKEARALREVPVILAKR